MPPCGEAPARLPALSQQGLAYQATAGSADSADSAGGAGGAGSADSAGGAGGADRGRAHGTDELRSAQRTQGGSARRFAQRHADELRAVDGVVRQLVAAVVAGESAMRRMHPVTGYGFMRGCLS